MQDLRKELIFGLRLGKNFSHDTYFSKYSEKFPQMYYRGSEYELFFKKKPSIDDMIAIRDNIIDLTDVFYEVPAESFISKRDNLKAVTLELSYSLSTQKNFRKFKNVLDIMIKGEDYLNKEKNVYYKQLADGLIYGSDYDKELEQEIKTQLYALFSIDYEEHDSSEETIKKANKIVREIEDTIHVSKIIYPSPYDIYQTKGVFGFTEEKTASEDFHALVEEHLLYTPEESNKQDNTRSDTTLFEVIEHSPKVKTLENTELIFETEKIGAKKKFKQNISAIRLVKEQKSNYTLEEKKVLSRYTGFGGIPQAFIKVDGSISIGWEKETEELKNILSKEEYADARRSTLSAFYTPSPAVEEIYKKLTPLLNGKDSIKVLEPSVGNGIFIQNMPQKLFKKSQIDAIELDKLTYDIFSALQKEHTNIEAYNMSYLDFEAKKNSYDLIIGNPPFSNVKMKYGEDSLYLHEHFILKSMDLLKEDGVMALVVSNSFMDSKSDFKQLLKGRTGAEIISAIRLPSSAFAEEAHTEVVTDIIYMQKNVKLQDDSWLKEGVVNGVPINAYYENNEKHLLGEWSTSGTMYQGDRPNLLNDNFVWKDAFKRVDPLQIDKKIFKSNEKDEKATLLDDSKIKQESEREFYEILNKTKIGSLFIHEDTLYERTDDINTKVFFQKLHIPKSSKDNTLSETKINKLKPFIEMKNTLLELSKKQLDNFSTQEEISQLREQLNQQYDAQAKKGNYLNKTSIKSLLKYDAQYPLLLALEKSYTKAVSRSESDRTGKPITKESAEKSDIFFKRTQYPEVKIESAETPEDALSISMGEKGKIDLAYMATLLSNYDEETVKDYLEEKSLIYEYENQFLTKAEFLSGDVKTKYEKVDNPKYKRDLREVFPKDINPYDIEVEFGASWIDSKYIEEFINKLNDKENSSSAYYTKYNSQWVVDVDAMYGANHKYGTDRYNFKKTLSSAINNKKIAIYDTFGEERIFNKQATFLANQKAKLIKKEFSDWIFEDTERREYLATKYNQIFNRRVERSYDGSLLPFSGKVDDSIIKLRPHQKNAAYRMALEGKALFDHTVGTGKTFTLIAGLSELKRMGKINKPLVVVPNHKVSDWQNDWLTLYPNASILAPEEKDFKKENRQQLFSRMVTSDYDAIIIGHSQLIKIDNDPDFEAEIISKEIDEIQESIETMRRYEGKDTRSIKNAEKKQESLENRYEELTATQRDGLINFNELGIDYLAVDESHEFKNLPYSTTLTGVAGLGTPKGAKKALDLYMKVRYIEEVIGKPNIAFLTGTPISNTVAELYLVEKYLNEDSLIEQGLNSFDAWVKQYAKVETLWQLSATGQYKAKDVLSTFQNLPELMQSYRSYADVITNEQIQEILKAQGEELPLPKMIGGKPNNIIIEKSPTQEEYIGIMDEETKQYPQGSLIYRSENLPTKPTKGADNMLVIIDNAKKCALDMRIIDPLYDDSDDDTKTKAMLKEALEQYKKYDAFKGTQLIFCDLSVPKRAATIIDKELKIIENQINNTSSVEKKQELQEQLEIVKIEKKESMISDFSVYADIKDKLLSAGIPDEEIAFIHSYDTGEKKEKLYESVNAGKIRFLLGSTGKMGAGTNVQERLVGLHNLDAPWKPSDLEQREGRIIRQGNLIYNLFKEAENGQEDKFKQSCKKIGISYNDAKNFIGEEKEFRVMVNRYATKGTLDSRMWEILEQKAKFIEKLKQPTNSSLRKVKDTELESMSAGEMKALASDNPLILKNLQLERSIDDLRELKKAHNKSLAHIETKVNKFQYLIDKEPELLSNLEKDVKMAELMDDSNPQLEIKGFNTNGDYKVEALGSYILNEGRIFYRQGLQSKTLGKLGDFDLEFHENTEYGFRNWIQVDMIGEHEEPYSFQFDLVKQSPTGLVTKIKNLRKEPKYHLGYAIKDIADAKENIKGLKEELKPFAQDEELQKKEKMQARIVKELAKPKHEQNPDLFNDNETNVKEERKGLNESLSDIITTHLEDDGENILPKSQKDLDTFIVSLNEIAEHTGDSSLRIDKDAKLGEFSLHCMKLIEYDRWRTASDENSYKFDEYQKEVLNNLKEKVDNVRMM